MIYKRVVFVLLFFTFFFLIFWVSGKKEDNSSISVNVVISRFKVHEQIKRDKLRLIEEEKNRIEEMRWERAQQDLSVLPLEHKQLDRKSTSWQLMIERGCDPEKALHLLYPQKWNISWSNFPTKEIVIKEENGGVLFRTDKNEELIMATTLNIEPRDYKICGLFNGDGLFQVNYTFSGGGKPPKSFSETFTINTTDQKIMLYLKNEKERTKLYIAFRIRGNINCSNFELLQSKDRF